MDLKDLARMPFLTVPQAAELLQVSEKTILRLIKAGKMEATRFWRQWRIPSAQFLPTEQSVDAQDVQREAA